MAGGEWFGHSHNQPSRMRSGMDAAPARLACTMLGWFMALETAASMMAIRSCFSAPLMRAGRTMTLIATVVWRHSPLYTFPKLP